MHQSLFKLYAWHPCLHATRLRGMAFCKGKLKRTLSNISETDLSVTEIRCSEYLWGGYDRSAENISVSDIFGLHYKIFGLSSLNKSFVAAD